MIKIGLVILFFVTFLAFKCENASDIVWVVAFLGFLIWFNGSVKS